VGIGEVLVKLEMIWEELREILAKLIRILRSVEEILANLGRMWGYVYLINIGYLGRILG
jgi:hypothetical protein